MKNRGKLSFNVYINVENLYNFPLLLAHAFTASDFSHGAYNAQNTQLTRYIVLSSCAFTNETWYFRLILFT